MGNIDKVNINGTLYNIQDLVSGYITGISATDVTVALGFTPYNATNPSGYITGISATDVTSALGYTPYNSTNPSGYISGISATDVTTALGYTPYNSTNPNGYTTNTGTVTSVGVSGASGLTSSGGPITGSGTITIGHSNSVTAQANQALYPIKIDAQGHISGYGSAVTQLPASDVYDWAKAATKPTYNASEVGAVATSAVGAASGVVPLNASSKIDTTYLPSYVDDVIEGYYYNSKFYKEAAHTTEITGESGKIYVDLSTNKTYRYSGTTYTEIAQGSVVTVTRNLTSGTEVGTITVDATTTTFYAPTNTDQSVLQQATSSNENFPILFKATANTSNETSGVRFAGNNTITISPTTGRINATTFNGYTLAAAAAKGVDNSITAASTGTNVVTASAVASFVEGKGYLTSYTETDPVFSESAAAGISAADITNWNSKTSNTGTVTSVGISAGTGLTVSGSPVTTSGTITVGHSNSVTAQTTQAVYPIKIDASGHISGYGSAVSITDEKVLQTDLNGLNSSLPVLIASNNTSPTTSTIYKTSKLLWNDYGPTLYIYNSDKTKYASLNYHTISLANSTNTYKVNLTGSTPTSNISVTLPTVAGTLALTSDIPGAYTSNPAANGTASSGTSGSWARGDHVHPTDTTRAASDHVHGNITNGGDITTTVTIASGDRLVINDESESKINNSSITFGSSTTLFLANNGTWQNPAGGVTSVNAGTGISVSATTGSVTVNHSNSITAQTTQAVYPIKIDAQGHISGYGSAVTISDTTYTLSMSGNRISLTPSSGTGSYVDLPVYNGAIQNVEPEVSI